MNFLEPVAEQKGIDLRALLAAGRAKQSEERLQLVERLQESVTPLFINRGGARPDRIGSCVLVRLDSGSFAFTAAHVIEKARGAKLLAPSEGKGGELLPLPPCTATLRSSKRSNDLDIAVLALPARQLGCFQKCVFLSGNDIDREDRPDEHGIESSYLLLGYSGSRTQVKVDRFEGQIRQKSFQYRGSPICAVEYLQERLPQADHIALDYDHKEIVIGAKRVNPPKLQGVSGGGIFHISRETTRSTLVAIATEHRTSSRLIVGTRMKHFLAVARELKPKG